MAGLTQANVYTTRPDGDPVEHTAELAQLDRASVYETEGRRFDSCIPRHFPSATRPQLPARIDLPRYRTECRSLDTRYGRVAWRKPMAGTTDAAV